jgi:hypothetical protein
MASAMKVLLLLLALACTATARVGEKYEDFRARLGIEPVSEDTEVKGILKARFNLPDFWVVVWVLDDTISFEQYGGGIYKQLAEAILAKYPDKWESTQIQFEEIQGWKNAKGYIAELNGGRFLISDGRFSALAAEQRRKLAEKQVEKL